LINCSRNLNVNATPDPLGPQVHRVEVGGKAVGDVTTEPWGETTAGRLALVGVRVEEPEELTQLVLTHVTCVVVE